MNRIIIPSAGVHYMENYQNNEKFKDAIEVAANISNI